MAKASTTPLAFAPSAPGPDIVYLNRAVWLQCEDELCVVWVHYAPWQRFLASSELDHGALCRVHTGILRVPLA